MAKLDFLGYEEHAFIPYAPHVLGTETLAFLTDIVTTHNGDEDRTRNRSIARQSLTYRVRTDLLTRQSPFNLAHQNIRGKWAVPLWIEAQFVGMVSGTTINCDVDASDFRVGNLVLVFQNDKAWQVAEIAAIGNEAITLTSALDGFQNALLLPINQGIMRGDVTNSASGNQSVYGFNFDVFKPKPFPTKISVLLAIDNSGSMRGDRMASTQAQIKVVLEALKGAYLNSNVAVDLGITYFSTRKGADYERSWPAALEEDFDEALAYPDFIDALNLTFGTNHGSDEPENAFEFANEYFGTISPNPGDRKDVMFFMTDTTASTTAARAEGIELITGLAPFNFNASVDVYAVNIDLTSQTQALKVDNASGGVIPSVNSDTPNALFLQLLRSLEPTIGAQHKSFEVLTNMPVSSSGSIAKGVSKIEDEVDFDLGVFDTRSPWNSARVGFNVGYFIDGLDELAAFKRFFYRRAGKEKPLYIPSFEQDVRFSSFSGDLLSGFISNDDYAAFEDGIDQLAVRFTNDVWQFLTVTNVDTTIDGGFRLDFEYPVEKALRYVERGLLYG